MKVLKQLTLISTLLSALTSTQAADLNVEISGLTEARGEVLVSLFNQSEGWMRKGIAASKTPAQIGSVNVTFPGLPEGDYAVSAIHDLNGNRRLDSNAIGMPIEPYGFSNDATGNFGPPSFEQAKFQLGKESKSISLKLG